MTIKLTKETERRLVSSIKRFAVEHLEEEMGDLKAVLLLEYALAEIGPCVYNQAIADAQTQMQERVADLEGACYEAEFTYWKP